HAGKPLQPCGLHSFTRNPDTASPVAENLKVAPGFNIILNGVENEKAVSSPLGPEVVDPLMATKVWKLLPPLRPSWGSFTNMFTSVAVWVVFLMTVKPETYSIIGVAQPGRCKQCRLWSHTLRAERCPRC